MFIYLINKFYFNHLSFFILVVVYLQIKKYADMSFGTKYWSWDIFQNSLYIFHSIQLKAHVTKGNNFIKFLHYLKSTPGLGQ